MTTVSLRLGYYQNEILSHPARFKVAVCGRRFGKTYLAGIRLLLQAKNKPKSFSMFVAPSYRQLFDPKDGIFALLQKLIPPQDIKKIHQTSGEIHLWNQSVIQIRSGDAQQQDNLRGGGLDLLVLDEYADMEPTIWTQILAPRLADTNGEAIFIGTPKGFNHFYDLFRDAERHHNSENIEMNDWQAFQYTTAQGGRVRPIELRRFKGMMSKTEYEQEFLATFTSLAGRVYSNFSGDRNYINLADDLNSPIYTGWDFNTAPTGLSIVVAQKRGPTEEAITVLEAFSFQGTTSEAISHLKGKYPNREIIACPDPAGGQLNSTGLTDFKLMRDAGLKVKGSTAHVPIKDRVNNVQANLLSADGNIRLYVNEKECEPLVKTFMGQTYDDKGQPSKGSGLDHFADSIGYLLWEASNVFRGRPQVIKWSPN